MKIRNSKDSEKLEIYKIHELAFGPKQGPEIADLVKDMFTDETAFPLLSLVAEENNKLLGHILFTKALISGNESVSVQLLAPLAVLPEAQKKGVGTQLINEGLKQLREAGVELVFVLGHPEYYPRCGFSPAGRLGFDAPYPIPEKDAGAWMMQELKKGFIGHIKGIVRCCDVLNEPQHWRE